MVSLYFLVFEFGLDLLSRIWVWSRSPFRVWYCSAFWVWSRPSFMVLVSPSFGFSVTVLLSICLVVYCTDGPENRNAICGYVKCSNTQLERRQHVTQIAELYYVNNCNARHKQWQCKVRQCKHQKYEEVGQVSEKDKMGQEGSARCKHIFAFFKLKYNYLGKPPTSSILSEKLWIVAVFLSLACRSTWNPADDMLKMFEI